MINQLKPKSAYILLFIVFFLLHLAVFAQSAYSFIEIGTASYTGNMISTDDNGNLLIASGSNLTKLDMDGNFLSHYHPLYQGKISCMDAKDPRRILIYYKDYSYVQFLNQELANAASLSIYSINSRPEPVDLNNIHLSYTTLVCLDDYNEAYWVYDSNSSDIVLIDKDNQIDFKADALDQFMKEDPNPNYMMMENGRLFINNPSTGVYIFDENGSFVEILPLMGLKKIQVVGDMLFYTTNTSLAAQNLVSGEITYSPLPLFMFYDWAIGQFSKPMRINFLTHLGVKIFSLDEMK